MSSYEQKAWDRAVRRLNAPPTETRKMLNRATGSISSAAGKVWKRVPLHADMEQQLEKALEGLVAVTLEPAMKSVSVERVANRVGTSFADFGTLDLERLDRASPRTRGFYTVTALAEGSASALAVTGATVATTVSGGTTAGVAIGAVAADVASSIALLGRIVAVAAAEYGYDVRMPDEEVFALGTISVGSAGSPAAKVAALTSLSRLTQQMMRKATWAQLNQNGLVKLIDAIFKALGLRLTHQKLGQAVPFAGVLINGGLSAQMADHTYRSARDVYRLRFLSDKYGIDPESWVTVAETLADDVVLGAALDDIELISNDENDDDESGEGDEQREGDEL